MIANVNQALSSLLSLSPSGASTAPGFTLPTEGDGKGSAGLGVSTAAAPLISAPATRQNSEFQASISPPTRPTNPSIAPPKEGGDNSLSGTGAQMGTMQQKLAFIAALRLEMASSGSNGPSGGKNEILSMMGAGKAA